MFSIDEKRVDELKGKLIERPCTETSALYTSDYAGSMLIESIKITGSNVQSVTLEAKFVTIWGRLKNQDLGSRQPKFW